MKYTQIPETAFEEIQLNAGILVDEFDPATGTIGNLLGATTGGIQFQDSIDYIDFGDDIDNCPKNMLELKKLDSHEVTMSGTFVTLSAATAKMLAGSADVDSQDATHIIPRNDLLKTDFTTLWWIGDYSSVNDGSNAGFVAIKMINALNTDGFQIQSGDKAKGQFAFTFTGHYSMDAQDTVPYEIYIKAGEEPTPPTPTTPSVTLDKESATVAVSDTVTLVATTVPAGETVSWESDDEQVATVTSGGVVEGVGAGTATITATITVGGTDYSDTCEVTVTSE